MTFIDTAGRTWNLALDVATVRRVKQQTDVNLLHLDDTQTLQRLVYDPMGLAAVLWSVAEPQAKSAGVSEEQFAAGLGGDTLTSATDALLEGIVGFFRPAQRRALKAALARLDEAETRMVDEVIQRVNAAPLPGDEPTPGG